MSSTLKGVRERYPLHALVWYNQHSELERQLQRNAHNLEALDPLGRTALHLAVSLDHRECVWVLLRHGADVSHENRHGWSVLQEAVSTRDIELLQLVLHYRDFQRMSRRLAGIPELMKTLRKARDFYVEMKWEFTSWVPLVARMCPSDVYKVWKSGSNLRVDTTLLGFEHMTWQRGERSFIFKGQDNGALVLEVDHDRRVVYVESLALTLPASELLLQAMRPTEEQLFNRLSSPIVTTHVNTKHIQFERSKSGIWGWRGEKCEVVNGYNAKAHITQTASATNPSAITAEEYFNPRFNLRNRDVGRPMNLTTKTQKFKAALWLCEAHPLSLSEQVIPIVDLMAISYSHFAKLRDFITLRLPPGFPIKIEIPLFHILNARITFGNLNGCEHPVSSVHSCVSSDSPSPSSDTSSWCSITSSSVCEVESSVFEAPKGYTVARCSKNEPLRDEDNDLLQFAIQQSLLDAGSESDQVTVWEALTNSKPGSHPLAQHEKCQNRPNAKPASSITSSAVHHPIPPISPRPGSSRGTPHRTSVSLGRARLKGGAGVQSSPAAKPLVGSPVQRRPTGVDGNGATKAKGGEEWTDTVKGSFAKQLRFAVHLSAGEHEERPHRQRRGGERGQNCPG